jgi:hypothetical protein
MELTEIARHAYPIDIPRFGTREKIARGAIYELLMNSVGLILRSWIIPVQFILEGPVDALDKATRRIDPATTSVKVNSLETHCIIVMREVKCGI